MSSHLTENFGLHIWEGQDSFLREEFNENFTRLDGASRVVTGAYTGNGEESQFIDLGFTPAAVLVLPEDGSAGGSVSGMAFPGRPVTINKKLTNLTVEEAGFKVYFDIQSYNSFKARLNAPGVSFYYLALR